MILYPRTTLNLRPNKDKFPQMDVYPKTPKGDASKMHIGNLVPFRGVLALAHGGILVRLGADVRRVIQQCKKQRHPGLEPGSKRARARVIPTGARRLQFWGRASMYQPRNNFPNTPPHELETDLGPENEIRTFLRRRSEPQHKLQMPLLPRCVRRTAPLRT